MASREPVALDGSILWIRGRRVMLAADLAKIYGVETRVLNQAVNLASRLVEQQGAQRRHSRRVWSRLFLAPRQLLRIRSNWTSRKLAG